MTADVLDLSTVRGALAAAAPLSAEQITAVEEAVRADLTGAVAHLGLLREAGAAELSGFDSWGGYVLARFGDLLDRLRLAVEDRRAVVHALRGEGASKASVARRLSVSEDTVTRDLDVTGDPAPDRIVSADGSSRVARTGRAVAPEGKLWERAAEVARRRGGKGVTLVELARALSITEGSASGLLTYLLPATARHPQRKGLLVRTEDRRKGQRVHVYRGEGA